jgi:transposase
VDITGLERMAKRARKRRIWTDDEKRMICRQSRLPGVSVSQVARRYDVNANLVFTWLRDARFEPEGTEPSIEASAVEVDQTAGSVTTAFLPVELVEEADTSSSPDASAAPHPTGVMEIVLAGGHHLRIEGAYDPDALARFLRALSEPGP